MTTFASYLILIALSFYAFFDGARDKVLFDIAVKRDVRIVTLIEYDLEQLQSIEVDA